MSKLEGTDVYNQVLHGRYFHAFKPAEVVAAIREAHDNNEYIQNPEAIGALLDRIDELEGMVIQANNHFAAALVVAGAFKYEGELIAAVNERMFD